MLNVYELMVKKVSGPLSSEVKIFIYIVHANTIEQACAFIGPNKKADSRFIKSVKNVGRTNSDRARAVISYKYVECM